MAEIRRQTEGLPEAGTTQMIELAGDDTFELEDRAGQETNRRRDGADARVQRLDSRTALKVMQGSTITVNVTNRGDIDATVHWHGLRLENRYDGTHDTQAPIPVGESFTYRVHVPDAGAYWYHPHIREDYGQELGLYGNILVSPTDPDYWPQANRELLLTLDDVLIEDGQIAAFSESGDHACGDGALRQRDAHVR